jgi:hypothetical protein
MISEWPGPFEVFTDSVRQAAGRRLCGAGCLHKYVDICDLKMFEALNGYRRIEE